MKLLKANINIVDRTPIIPVLSNQGIALSLNSPPLLYCIAISITIITRKCMAYWLFKTEPDAFSIGDLNSRPDQTEPWDGVRNYQARNFLRDKVAVGDQVFIYHSSCKIVGIAGVAEVVKAGYPDETQFNPESNYYDPKSTRENPRWFRVDVKFVEKFESVLPLSVIKAMPNITEIGLVKKGGRLSIMPVEETEWQQLYTTAKMN